MTQSIQSALLSASQTLARSSPSARLDAELLLCHLLGKNRTYLYSYPEYTLTQSQRDAFQAYIAQREQGVPIAYLLGEREFWSLPLAVTPNTLIPRPETEYLVELSLNMLEGQQDATLLDLGTGTGAIALALASSRPQWQLIASDVSMDALRVAQKNINKLNIRNVSLLCSDWLSALLPTQTFDLIVSNPPYIADNDPHLLAGDVRFEPRLALISGPLGLNAIDNMIKNAAKHIKPHGHLLIEHGYEQASQIQELLTAAGYKDVQSWQDQQGHWRITGGCVGDAQRFKARYEPEAVG